MGKQMMIKYIMDTLDELDEATVSEIYWLLKFELDQ